MKSLCVLLLAACGSTADGIDTVGYVPVSAVIIRSEAALGGRVCGDGSDAVIKYRVTVEEPAALKGQSANYDCFADAYVTPPETTELEQPVKVTVRGFSKAQVEAGALSEGSAVAPQMIRSCEGIKKTNVQTVLTCTAQK
jgi:hypothetical protein